ncbi:MAG: tetratricopeptide repeat protein [bacterium]|nr:tetratricopeptide repeat protein [bacterium]
MTENDSSADRADDDLPKDDSFDSTLDRALADGFAAARAANIPPQGDSVLDRIGEITGSRPKVSLRDAAADQTPMLKPLAPADTKDTGKYVIQGELGRGGVGAVHKGHDQDLGRDVAMKFLHDKYRDAPEILHRFVEEAQIGGQLQHPGIVPVYDLGMSNGKPFFAMKLVKGETLAKKLLDAEATSGARRKLLTVFEDICQTMAYAHARGVVHRDLKPSNIMIGSFGEVQVVDWGMGKVLQQGGVADERRAAEQQESASVVETVRSSGHGTQSVMGSVMGTPAYMPPEQARGDVAAMDERSDVFALGAILCEILTGSPPYTGAQDELIAMAAMARLDDANQRLSACDAEPELIDLAKTCLMPAPAARPRSAQEIATAIQEHLAALESRVHDARVEAAEATVRAAALRRTQRLGAALIGVFIIGLATTLWFWHQSGLATERAETELARAVETKQLLIGMLEGITPEQARDADTTILRQILTTATRRIDDGSVPDERVAAELQSVVATVYRKLGEPKTALRHSRAASEALTRLVGPEDPKTIAALANLAITYKDLSEHGKAETVGRDVLARLRRIVPEDDDRVLRQRVSLGVFLAGQERFSEAEREYEAVIETCGRESKSDDPVLFNALSNLGELHARRGFHEQAEDYLRQALEGLRRIHGADHPTVALSMSSLARACTTNRKFDEAKDLYDAVLELQTKSLGSDHPRLLMTRSNLATLLDRMHRRAEAEVLYRGVLEVVERTIGPNSEEALGALSNLASTILHQDRPAEAEPLFKRALELSERRDGRDSTGTLRILENLSNVYLHQDRSLEAVSLMEDAVGRSEARWGQEDPATLRARARLAFAYASAMKFAAAESLLEKLIPQQASVLGEQGHEALDSMLTLARVYKAQRKTEESVDLLEDLLQRRETKHGSDHADHARVALELGRLYIDLRRFEEGIATLSPAIPVYRTRVGPGDRDLALAESSLGLAHMLSNDAESAVDPLESALPVIRRFEGKDSQFAAEIATNLASAYLQTGRLEEAEPMFLEQIEALESHGGVANAAGARTNLGSVYLRMERFADAARMFEASLPVKRRFLGNHHPWTGFAVHGLALAYRGLGRNEEALPLFREHLEAQIAAADRSNSTPMAVIQTARLLLTHPVVELRDPKLAARLAEHACEDGAAQEHPQLYAWLDTLAQAQSANGDAKAAFASAQRAVDRLPTDAPPESASEIRSRLEEYRAAAEQK